MPKTLLPALLLGAALAPSAASAAATPSLFDPPLETKTILLPPSATAAKTKLTCRYYQRFMVKEIDEGEVGAAQLSIVPVAAESAKPACQRAKGRQGRLRLLGRGGRRQRRPRLRRHRRFRRAQDLR